MIEIYIPRRTQEKLANPAPEGQRHHQATQIAISLIAQGMCESAVFAQMRNSYGPNFADNEIHKIIQWVNSKGFSPCGRHPQPYASRRQETSARPREEKVTAESATRRAEEWLRGFRCDEADLWEVSPCRPTANWHSDALTLFVALYGAEERINIVTEYELGKKSNGDEKAKPKGAGVTRTCTEWMKVFGTDGVPESEAGAWMRPNPVTARGTGYRGAFCDADVGVYRFLLIESDMLPPELQLSTLARLPLPLVAILSSGGPSFHAWAKVNCTSEEEYREKARTLLGTLEPFGFDPSNKNPSRLSRLPGALRKIGAQTGGEQRLLYLNPESTYTPIFGGK